MIKVLFLKKIVKPPKKKIIIKFVKSSLSIFLYLKKQKINWQKVTMIALAVAA